MGVYPVYSDIAHHMTENGGETWVQRRSEPGVVYSRDVVASPWVEAERTDCYPCTCEAEDEYEVGSDPYCRNHGWDGRRPCEKHNLPGELDEQGHMPASVERIRRDRAERAKRGVQ